MPLVNQRSIRLHTWLDDDVLLLEHATLNEELGRAFEFQLDLLSSKKDITLADAVWQSMTISVDLPAGGTRYFNGIVTRFAAGEFTGEYTRYRATLRPWLWTLTRVSDCRIFQNMTVPEVVKEVCRGLGFTDFKERLTEKYRTWEYLVQYRESSFNFVSRIMEQEGLYYYFEHSQDAHTMVLADSHGGHAPFPNYKTITYLPPEALQSGVRGEVEHISRWQLARQVQPVAYTVEDFNFEAPRATLLATLKATDDGDEGGAAFESYDYPGGFKDSDQGQQAVKLIMQERRAQLERAHGAGNARGLATGSLFTLDDYPIEGQNKEHLLLATSCALTPNLFDSGSASHGPEFHCTFEAMDSQRPFRTARKTPKPMVQGPQTAIVVGEAGEEITTDKYGRVRVQFHWDRVGTSDENSSCWVRVAQIWAGSGWGAMHIPRIGQEVIVEFLEGDPDRPIITGRVYNADNMPPYKLPANKTQSGIKSRSTKDGGPNNFNEIRFEDKKGSEELHIQAERDQTTHVKRNQSISVDGDRSVSVGGNESISVTGTRTSTITKNETQTFKADRAMTVTGTDLEEVTGHRTEKDHGGREVTIESGDALTVVGSNKTDTIHGQYDITADTEFKVTQGSNTMLIKDSVDVNSVGEIHLHNPQSSVDLKDGVLKITSATEIVLECGSAKISLKSDGTIEIGGSQKVTANGGGAGVELQAAGATMSGTKATVSGTAMTEITGAMVKIN